MLAACSYQQLSKHRETFLGVSYFRIFLQRDANRERTLNVFHKSVYTCEFRTRGPNKNTYLTICREIRRTINKCVRSLLTLRLKLIKFGIAARVLTGYRGAL